MPPEPVIDVPFPLANHNSLPEKALRVPAEMVLQIASGLDKPEDIAARYGYDEETFTALKAWQPFVQEVAKVRAELEKSGFDFVLDSRLKAKELSNTIFLRAMATDATFGQVHDAFRTFTEFADLKPKPAQNMVPANAPSGFSITFVLNTPPEAKPDPKNATIDVTPVEEPPKEVMGTRNPFTVETA
jgi:hypothetical protein